MGLRLGWIAVQSGLKAELLDRLGFEPIGETSDEVGEAYTLADTPNGWTILVMDRPSADIDDRTIANTIPKGACLTGAVNETVMYSDARSYQDGRLIWSVARDPDTGPGLLVQGEPPSALIEIQRGLEIEQAKPGSEGVDLLFDAPVDLAAELIGYRPAGARLEWQILGRKDRRGLKAPAKPQKSLYAAIQADLLPLIWSLGWQSAVDKPQVADAWHIFRNIGGQKQTLWFDYASGPNTYVRVRFDTLERLASGSNWWVMGWAQDPPLKRPFWKLFTWSRLSGGTQHKPELADPIQAAIDKAKVDILAVDAFLKGDGQAACIHVQWAREVDGAPES